ncbi:MAG: signal peptidase II [Holosporales bacterium]|nr:signal peptidase II [Holosporales bacterium]
MKNKLLSSQRFVGVIVFLFIILIDQISKFFICRFLTLGSSITVFKYINFVYVMNSGVSFGLFSDGKLWQLVLINVAIILAFIWLIKEYFHSTHIFHSIAIALIMGGATGNVLDRIFYGAVVDFIDFHINNYTISLLNIKISNWHWPAFNIADSAITCGVFLLLLRSLKTKK